LNRGWPLYEAKRSFELGHLLDCSGPEITDFAVRQALGQCRSGWWECDLRESALTWTAGVYDIFGLPHGSRVARKEAVGRYCETSRAVMERLRSHAIASGQGFVLDARIRPANGEPLRWMRLIGAPVMESRRAVLLQGLKLGL
jgi:PAS domain-containing protein